MQSTPALPEAPACAAGATLTSHPGCSVPPLVPLFTGARAREFAVGLLLWAYATLSFWAWWFDAGHNIGTLAYVVTSAILAWINLMPAYFLFVLCGARVPNPAIAPPPNARVAMVVTKAPSEPFDVVRITLEAMLSQDYPAPYDVWLADEDPAPETLAWCKARGVKVSTRRGRADYHRPAWPRRTRCKEGNLAYFYDVHGYDAYDFVCQFDADHVPAPSYLTEALRPFNDPAVGYVSAPSICDRNAAKSWSARGRLYVEASLHGALEAGYSGRLAPLCIGSHYAVRTRALKAIGGLGPELAEDHSTTLLMNAGGWRGVHALNAIATGDGPVTFTDLVVQEFQWSRSLMTLLLQYTPAYLPCLPLRLKAQFLFCQLWYPLFGFFMLLMFLLPLIALGLDRNMVDVTYPEFVIRFATPSIVLIALAAWWRKNGLLRPYDARIFSWEGMLFLYARWPWALWGVCAAIADTIRGTPVSFKVTPKGGARSALPPGVIMPYVALAAASAVPVMLFDSVLVARGFLLFALLNALIYTLALAVILIQDSRENARPVGWRNSAALLCCAGLTALAISHCGTEGLTALTIGAEDIWARVRTLQDY
jgi:cellulose synthase (UDP-forming)